MTSWAARHDPPVRSDGKCSYCGAVKPTPDDPKRIYRVDLDPFCSTKCCKEYYHISFDASAPMSRDMSQGKEKKNGRRRAGEKVHH